jgi:hypothetical protein
MAMENGGAVSARRLLDDYAWSARNIGARAYPTLTPGQHVILAHEHTRRLRLVST